MADPFKFPSREKIDAAKRFFGPTGTRPNVLGTRSGLRALETERRGLSSFLGQTDYDTQLEESKDLAKLQIALSLMKRGFAAAGATPVRGESAASTLSRELLSPVAGDITPIASDLLKQRRAVEAAKRQEERQLKLAALQNVQQRQAQDFESAREVEKQAQQFALQQQQVTETLSNDYTVDGVSVPVIVRKDSTGKIIGIFDSSGEDSIDYSRLKTWRTPAAAVKDKTEQVSGIEVLVVGPKGKETYRPVPATMTTTFNANGTVSSRTLTESTTGNTLVTSGENKNARQAPKAGTTGSNYFSPGKGTPIYLNPSMVTAFGLPGNLVNKKATLRTLVPKPEAAKEFNLPRIQTIEVAGRTITVQDHKDYNKETGNIDITDPKGIKTTYNASNLWSLEDPKSFSPVPGLEYTVPSGEKLEQIKRIPGLSQITGGQKLTLERNDLGEERVRWGRATITLTPAEATLFQTKPLSETQKIKGGLTPVKWDSRGEFVVSPENLDQIRAIAGLSGVGANDVLQIEEDQLNNFRVRLGSVTVDLQPEQAKLFQTRPVDTSVVSYVNTSAGPISVGGQPVPVGGRINLSKERYVQLSTNNPSLAVNLQPATPVETKATSFMFTGSGDVGETSYGMGDSISLSPAEFKALPIETQKLLTGDPKRKDIALKKKAILEAWRNLAKTEPLLKAVGDPTAGELDSLVALFPPGTRAQGRLLRDEIFNVLKYRPGDFVDLPFVPTKNPVSDANTRAFSYKERVKEELENAWGRYYKLRSRGALPDRDWETLSYFEKRAFADLPRVLQLRNANGLWQKAKENLAKERKDFVKLDQGDVEAYAATAELAILAKQLRDSSDLSETGAFFGWWSGLQSSTFADLKPITSGGTQRLRSIINAMKTRYQTLTRLEGDTKPSNFRVALQQELIPEFTKAESLNKKNLNILIQRLETSLRVPFGKEILDSTVIPQSFEAMAAQAGVAGKTNPRRYRWIDPGVTDTPPVTKRGLISQVLGQSPFTFKDAQNLAAGQTFPIADDNRIFIKIRNNKDGSVVVQEARKDGKPDSNKSLHTLTEKYFSIE